VIGAKIGQKIDEGDRGCWGHALGARRREENGGVDQPGDGINYRLTPTRNFQEGKLPCREFSTLVLQRRDRIR